MFWFAMEDEIMDLRDLWQHFIFAISVSYAICVVATILDTRRKSLEAIRTFVTFRKSQTARISWVSMTLRGTAFWIVCAISCTILNRLKSQPQLIYFFTIHPSKDFNSLSMVSSIFAHREIYQLTWNLTFLGYLLGYGPFSGDNFFWAIFLSCGIFSSFSSLTYKVITRKVTHSFGMTGALYGMVGAILISQPDRSFQLPYLTAINLRAKFLLLGIFLFECSEFRLQLIKNINIDHAGLIGGLFTGMCLGTFGSGFVRLHRRILFRLMRRWREKDVSNRY